MKLVQLISSTIAEPLTYIFYLSFKQALFQIYLKNPKLFQSINQVIKMTY